jgi:nucleotide-binding universal stress UspA family protein
MIFKSILVHVDDAAGVEARIRFAAHLACESHARVIGASICLPPAAASLQARGKTIVAVGIGEGGTIAKHAIGHKVFESVIAPFGVEFDWRAADDLGAHGLARAAAAADIIICGPTGNADLVPGDLIMQAGRPVLVVPPDADHLGRGHAVVAWKNTRESRRALADAVPLLMRFAAVTLVHVSEGRNDEASIEEAAAFLEHHGIAARQKSLPRDPSASPADQIARLAVDRSADLIVLGAFGHSRAREWIFGGVTADFLRTCPVPCLFSR